jgi:hypothetical protein
MHVLKNDKKYQSCPASTLEKTLPPVEGYMALLDATETNDFSPDHAQDVYKLQANLLPTGFIPAMDRTNKIKQAVRAGQNYWPSYMQSNARRIRSMPMGTQEDVNAIHEELSSAFNPDFGGSKDYLVGNRNFREIVFETLEEVFQNAARNGFELDTVTPYESHDHFCAIVASGAADYGDHRVEVLGGAPYFTWTRESTEGFISALESCENRDANDVAQHYQKYILPAQQAWKTQLREEEAERKRQAELERKREEERKKREAERKRQEKLAKERSGPVLEKLAAWIEDAKDLPVDRETFLETNGYTPKDIGSEKYTTTVYELQQDYFDILAEKRSEIREEIATEIPQKVKITDDQLLSDDFTFDGFKNDFCGMPEFKDLRDGYIIGLLQDHCMGYIDEAKARQKELMIAELNREKQQACNAFIGDLDVSDDLIEADFSLNIRMPNGEVPSSMPTRDLLCQMNQNGSVEVEALGWLFNKGYKITYKVDNAAEHDELRRKAEEVSKMMTDCQ